MLEMSIKNIIAELYYVQHNLKFYHTEVIYRFNRTKDGSNDICMHGFLLKGFIFSQYFHLLTQFVL